MTLLTVGVGFGFSALLLSGFKLRPMPGHVLLLVLLLQTVGFSALGTVYEGWDVATVATASALAFSLGYCIAQLVLGLRGKRLAWGPHRLQAAAPGEGSSSQPQLRLVQTPPPALASRRGVHLVLGVFLGLTIFHYANVGIPLFASNPELARWTLGDSGLFGLPGRALAIGLPLSLAYLVASKSPLDRWLVLGTVASVFLLTLSGFRGVLATTVLLLASVAILRWSPSNLSPRQLLFAILVVSVSIGAVPLIGLLYESEGAGGQLSIAWTRATVGGIDAAHQVLGGGMYLPDLDSIVLRDFSYYLSRYLPTIATDGASFDASSLVSSAMTGRTLGGVDFIVPVTIPAVATFIYDFGVGATVVAFLGFGLCWCAIEKRVSRAPEDWVALALLGSLLFFAIRGNLAFNLLNWVAVGLLARFIAVLDCRFAGAVTSRVAG